MPLRLRVWLDGAPPAEPFQHMTGLRALILKWIGAADPAMAKQLHETNSIKPYTISPFFTEKSSLSLEIGVLADEIGSLLLEGARKCGAEIKLGRQSFTRRKLELFDEVSWPELLPRHAPQKTEIAIQLLTPTAHHQAGPYRKAVPVPQPENYFASWLCRWNRFSPTAIDTAILKTVERAVAVKAFCGRAEMVPLDRGRCFIGFVGEVTFQILKPEKLAVWERCALWALARSASYCGTGVETVRGMGQTRLGRN